MRIVIREDCKVAGRNFYKGGVWDLADHLADRMINAGKATPADRNTKPE